MADGREMMLRQAEAVALRGLATGYASGEKAKPVPGRPGWKFYEYVEGPWYLRDEYYVDPVTGKSVGRVELENNNVEYPYRLVWFMAYGGFYKKEAIPCLKSALMEHYSKGVFLAGRGAVGWFGGYRYDLHVQSASFERFYAHEHVSHEVKREVGGSYFETDGGHEVWGMALI